MKHTIAAWIVLIVAVLTAGPLPAKEKNNDKVNSDLVSGLPFRGIGPAFMSGRIGDIAVDPVKTSTWYVAVASGNVWKTVNAGTTWEPIFDKYGSYSIGCVTVDPNNRHVIWVGTGENNSQRSVGYGDGVYKSLDGGKHFEKVGLENSEHIGRILVDPRDSDVVYVAAQGPLWAPGGDRGLYKTTDGGATWALVLEIDENTGVTDVHFDPRNPDVLYAAAYQRRRHVWVLIDGGPGSGIYKSTDAGANWKKIKKGLPSTDMGRIGMAVSPQDPDVLYAIVEAARDEGGFFRSSDGGENWKKQCDYVSNSPQYYQEIFTDPHTFDRVYSLDTRTKVSSDGGKTWSILPKEFKHVDDHALYIDPENPNHLLIGSDGGLYETWDQGKNHRFFANLPVTQFYKIAVDNSLPFYYIYGGTQDNATQGGPSRTTNIHGIRNSDWFVTVFGDGFDPAVDPEDPNIVYSQWQYGGLVRFDRKTGERIDIKPQEDKGGPPLRWNWDSALMISPHSNTRLYYGSQKLFRSDDRGDSWRAVSPDLTRNMDRNTLEVMGRVWSVDAVAKNNSTSFYGTIVAVSESPLQEDLIYVGTDDGLIQVTDDGGAAWQKIDKIGDVPEMTYVNDIEASLYDANTVYAALNNHKRGDFKPYVMKSTDRGKKWKNIAGNLPERGSVYAIAQDHQNETLLFAGTEFGVFFTVDEGANWVQLKKGIPTISVRDLEIQRRENDLVAGTFGRGFYVLDDYTPLRYLDDATLDSEAVVFPVKKSWMYIQDRPFSGKDKAYQGAGFFTAPNPPFGATFTYYLKEPFKTRKDIRHKKEDDLAKDGKDVHYPSWDALKTEDREEKPGVFLTVRDDGGNVVRRLDGKTSKGIHRVTWDFRYPGYRPTDLDDDGWGPLALPGTYTVSVDKRVDGVTTQLAGPTEFVVEPVGYGSLSTADKAEALAFQKKTGDLQRAVFGANEAAKETANRIKYIKRTIEVTPSLDPEVREQARGLELRLMDLQERLTGDPTKPRRSEPGMRGLMSRINQVVYGHWSTTYGPTETHKKNYDIAAEEFEDILDDLRQVIEIDLVALEDKLENAGAPWTPGRGVPKWKR
ncbi:MAG: glycosyl hydrolase [Candidatus Latescibacterota bacterium]|nr:MAG: glycosyl hydrolase [Candidatus Latescibacterota bacterium]